MCPFEEHTDICKVLIYHMLYYLSVTQQLCPHTATTNICAQHFQVWVSTYVQLCSEVGIEAHVGPNVKPRDHRRGPSALLSLFLILETLYCTTSTNALKVIGAAVLITAGNLRKNDSKCPAHCNIFLDVLPVLSHHCLLSLSPLSDYKIRQSRTTMVEYFFLPICNDMVFGNV